VRQMMPDWFYTRQFGFWLLIYNLIFFRFNAMSANWIQQLMAAGSFVAAVWLFIYVAEPEYWGLPPRVPWWERGAPII
jgi:hypothetical protein